MTTQQVSSIIRQIVAVAAVVFGAISAAISSTNAIHLPPAVSSVLVIAGSVIMAIEHYVGDPSTGSTTPVATTTAPDHTSLPVAPPS
jgi:hypothetical protein